MLHHLALVRCKRFDRKQNNRGPLLSRLWIKTAAVRTRSLTHVLCYYYSHVGASRGFAFVEFTKIQDAQTWMDEKKVAFQTHFNQKNKSKPPSHQSNQWVNADWWPAYCGFCCFKNIKWFATKLNIKSSSQIKKFHFFCNHPNQKYPFV